MDLVKIAGPAHYLPGRVNIGVIVGDGQAALVGTGLDESTARKAVQAIEQAGLRLAAVINTHSHADHCGGNAFVAKRTGAPPPRRRWPTSWTRKSPCAGWSWRCCRRRGIP
jgi:glyoxylase-like metal-dependent hydrolase (beta-lactamase superfamily II)